MRAGAWALLALSSAACVPDAGRPADRAADDYRLVVGAEDARPSGGDELDLLMSATVLEDPFLRRVGVRALGRLENPGVSDTIAGLLDDPAPTVRAAAAEALAQSVHRSSGAPVLDALLARVPVESDASARGMLARSIGRLRLDDADRRRAAQALVELADEVDETPPETLVGVALGFESLVRGSGGAGLDRPAADVLTTLLAWRPGNERDLEDAAHARALAAAALGMSRRLSLELIRLALEDPEPEVRRTVTAFLTAAPPSTRDELLGEALADPSHGVRIGAVQYLAGLARTAPRCALLVAAAGAGSPAPVRVAALQALERPCPDLGPQRTALVEAASEVGDPDAPWQPAAQALLSLTRIDTEPAARLLPDFVQHESAFVRTWAARVASSLRDVEALFALSVDPSPNVRNEAVQGLFAVEGHGLDEFLLEQLESDDPQLLITVAGLLEGTPQLSRAASALLDAFERISAVERETWRDPRLALLERVEELGDESMSGRLMPYLADYDPAVAARVAGVLEAWTGGELAADPAPLPRAPVPGRAELRTLERSTLTLHMRAGGTLVVELLADQAPTNVARVVRLAEEGYFDGLTFHRWVPNFVVQGGSPAANEYQGDGPYTRDEVGGVPHWRGTVGLSTRGRDTGDGQIFVNLVHNPHLDYDYTVLGRLVAGYDTLDEILEGDVIDRAVVTTDR